MFVRSRGVWFRFAKKDVYVLLGEIQKKMTCFLAKTTVILLFYSSANNSWSLRLLEKTW